MNRYMRGARRDVFDRRDHPYGGALLARASAIGVPGFRLPSYIDNSGLCTDISDQGDQPSCVGHAVAAAAGFLFWRDSGEYRAYSEKLQYYWARLYDEFAGEDYPGSTMRGGVEGWRKIGACPHALCGEPLPGQEEPVGARKAAAIWRLKRYERLMTDSEIKHAIHKYGIVLVTLRTHEGWDDDRGDTIAYESTMQLSEYHAAAYVGYDTPKNLWLVRNSWGEDWKKRGYAWYTDADHQKNMAGALLPTI